MRKKIVAVILAVTLSLPALSYLFRKEAQYYLEYYATRIMLKYHLLDFGIIPNLDKLNLVNENLDQLNHKVSMMLERKGRGNAEKALNFPPFFDEEIDSRNLLRRTYLLSVLINKLKELQDNPEQTKKSQTLKIVKKITGTPHSFEIELPQNIEIINKKIIIRNKGNRKIINPRIIINNQKKWFDLDSLVQEIIKPDMTNEEKALSIWKFLNKNRYHYYPATNSPKLHDVVKYLNAYGYGFCDDTSASFYLLATKAGLKARIWKLEGHVVSEVYYKNGWHILDSDHSVFYLDKDNKTIASLENLADNPGLIYRTVREADPSAEKVGNLGLIYATKENNHPGEFWMKTATGAHNLNYRLRPGETFEASWQGKGRYISNGKYSAFKPPKYGSGRFIYNLIFKQNILKSNNNITRTKENKITVSRPNQKGSFVIDFKTPYPITGAEFKIECFLKEKKDRLRVSFSRDLKKWWKISEITGITGITGKQPRSINFSNYFPNGYADPLYKYFLKFELFCSKADSLTIDKLTVVTNTQLAPQSLPKLTGGRNKVSYLSDSPQDQTVALEFHYSLGRKYHASPPPARPDKPQIDLTRILFSWKAPETDTLEALEYNFQLSGRSDFLIPLTPKFDIITKNHQVIVDRKWFNKGSTYYWRTRSRYENEPWGQFSQTEQFSY